MALSSTIIAAVAGGAQAYQASKAQNAQKDAANRARDEAARAAAEATRANNKANQKSPNLAALLAGNTTASGVGSTMLTGAQGAALPSTLLGGNSVLGL